MDEKTGSISLVARLDPERYEVTEFEGKPFLFDRFDRCLMPLDLVQQMITEALAREPTGRSQYLGNARKYIAKRRLLLRGLLTEETEQAYEHVDRSDDFLAAVPDGVHGFAFFSVDIVGSTMLCNSLSAESNARTIRVILGELAQLIPFFHGQVLKFTGDGLLGYVAPPSFLTANDNAIDCALTIRDLIHHAVNPSLQEVGLPVVDLRIGIESGDAVALSIGHTSSKQHRDLIGNALNMSCKIQTSASTGEIRLGYVAYRNIHTMWKKGCEPVPLPANWPYRLSDGRPYPLYRFSARGAILDHSTSNRAPVDPARRETRHV